MIAVLSLLTAVLWLLPVSAEAWPGGKKDGCGKGKKDKAAMHSMMMSMPREMVASGDGVIVLAGRKLYKYDADLNLVKEQTIPMDKVCPMTGKKLCQKGDMGDCGMKCCKGMKCAECEKCQKMMKTKEDNSQPSVAGDHAAHH